MKQRDELAAAVTSRYEEAYRVAADRYKRACLTAEWWPLYSHYRFQHSSELLMQASPHALAKDVSPALAEKIARQQRLFRAVFRGLLDIVEAANKLDDERRDAFADALSEEFACFAVIDIPDTICERLLRNLPVYAHDYIWAPDATDVAGNYRNTMRWDLWRAITLIPPDRVESECIQDQTLKFAKAMGKSMDDILQHAKVQPQGRTYAESMKTAFERMHGNRFSPYFHRCLLQYERKKCRETLREDVNQVQNSWQNDLADWADEPTLVPDSTYVEAAGRYQILIYSLAWQRYAHYRQPVWEGAIPQENIIRSGARLNRSQILAFTVQSVQVR
jgi:hypothetical protein